MSILLLENVSLNLGAANKPILKQLNYKIEAGDFVILLGANGSGKSSLLKLLHREYRPSSGHIYFLDKPLHSYTDEEFSIRVAALTQNSAESLFPSLTVYENYLLVKQHLKLIKSQHDQERVFLAEYVSAFNPNLPIKLDQLVSELSGGERQALALAFCLLEPPSLLLLDEHTSALDPKTSEQIMHLTQKMISQHHITCILTTHDLDIALQYGNRILILGDGEIYKTFDQDNKAQLSKEFLLSGYR